jgi:hypothetical protein
MLQRQRSREKQRITLQDTEMQRIFDLLRVSVGRENKMRHPVLIICMIHGSKMGYTCYPCEGINSVHLQCTHSLILISSFLFLSTTRRMIMG